MMINNPTDNFFRVRAWNKNYIKFITIKMRCFEPKCIYLNYSGEIHMNLKVCVELLRQNIREKISNKKYFLELVSTTQVNNLNLVISLCSGLNC